jgi:hypothetical protein
MLEFRLLYQGRLLGASRENTRPELKHAIRKEFHPQLKELWKTKSPLVERAKFTETKYEADQLVHRKTGIDLIADDFTKCGYRFVPVVTEKLHLRCALDILFLRREEPGMLIRSGDIDNRIKTVFDALKVPQNCSEIVGEKEEDEDPFFCLLEDDKLITEVRVTTDQLLMLPSNSEMDANDAFLAITVKVKPTRLITGNLDFA